MNKLTLDLEDVRNEDEFHDRVMTAFGFPHYYGRNRDAFWDCLSDFEEPTEVLVLGFDNLRGQFRTFVAGYLSLLQDRQIESNGELSVTIA